MAKQYHIGLTKPTIYGYTGREDTLIIEVRRTKDGLSASLFEYCGLSTTTKKALKERIMQSKDAFLKIANKFSWAPEGGFKSVRFE